MRSQSGPSRSGSETELGALRLAGAPEIRHLGRLARPQAAPICLALLLLAVYTALGLLVPWLVGGILEGALASGADPGLLDRLAIGLLAIFLLRALSLAAHRVLLARAGGRIVLDLRTRLYDKLLQFEQGFFDERRVGELISRVLSDVAQVQSVVTQDLAALISSALTVLGGLALMLFSSWRLTGVVMLAVVPVLLLGRAQGRAMRRLGEQVQERNADLAAQIEEGLGGIRLVQALVREPFERERFGRRAEQVFDAVMARVRASAVYGSAVGFLSLSSLSIGLWFGGREIAMGRLGAGELVASLIYVLMVGSSAAGLVGLYGRWTAALGACRRVFDLLDRESRIRSAPNAPRLDDVAGHVQLKDVCFAYRPNAPVLEHVDLELRPGETVALVGPSGAGKTSLLRLVGRFYEPDQGRILLDGRDIRDLDLGALRRSIGIVLQETVLFNASVLENLRYGKLEASPDEIRAAAAAANAAAFIEALPQGYDTPVGERGFKLSAGQRQRIAIARTLLADPRILLLDEATASQDSESEQAIQAALQRLRQGRSSLVIAHRLATVRGADRIAVLEGGRIVEEGDHRALLAAGGRYAHYHRLQWGS